jgi:hypothetical protein
MSSPSLEPEAAFLEMCCHVNFPLTVYHSEASVSGPCPTIPHSLEEFPRAFLLPTILARTFCWTGACRLRRKFEITNTDPESFFLSSNSPLSTIIDNMAPANLPSIFNATSQDIEMLLAAQCHLGSKNLQVHMEPYLWKTRADGVNVLNIGKTW